MEGLCRKDQVAMTARGPVNPDAAVFIAFFITGVKALFLKRVANARLAPRSDLSIGRRTGYASLPERQGSFAIVAQVGNDRVATIATQNAGDPS